MLGLRMEPVSHFIYVKIVKEGNFRFHDFLGVLFRFLSLCVGDTFLEFF